jgi:opacity protein-like surface antigen
MRIASTSSAVAALSVAVALVLLPAAPAAAQSDAPPPGTWQFQVTPYLWLAGVSGRVGLGIGSGAPVEAKFSSLFQDLKMGLMASFEGRRDRWGFLFDGMYIKLGATSPLESPYVDATLDETQQIYQLGGTYRLNRGKVPVDLVLGARYFYLNTTLTLTGPVGLGKSVSKSWVDAIVGARVQVPIAERLCLVGYGDVGSGGSNLSWQALAGLSYDFSKTVSGKVGYRYLSIDYDSVGFLYDMAQGGFFLGVGIAF